MTSFVIDQLAQNIIDIAGKVQNLSDLTCLDAAFGAIITRSSEIGAMSNARECEVRRAIAEAQFRIKRATRPVIDDLTKFMVVRRTECEVRRAIAEAQCETARATNLSDEFKIVVWL